MMSDVVKLLKFMIKNNPQLKEKLMREGAIEERDGEIVILSPEVFERMRIEWEQVGEQ